MRVVMIMTLAMVAVMTVAVVMLAAVVVQRRATSGHAARHQHAAALRHHDVRRRQQHRQRRYDSEQGKDNKAQSVHHHGGELPVTRHVRALVLLTQLKNNNVNHLGVSLPLALFWESVFGSFRVCRALCIVVLLCKAFGTQFKSPCWVWRSSLRQMRISSENYFWFYGLIWMNWCACASRVFSETQNFFAKTTCSRHCDLDVVYLDPVWAKSDGGWWLGKKFCLGVELEWW